jgi:predicted Kef-type K+ transport protein
MYPVYSYTCLFTSTLSVLACLLISYITYSSIYFTIMRIYSYPAEVIPSLYTT